MRPHLSPLAAAGLLGGLVACGGSRALDPPAPPPTVPAELLHTLRSPVGAVLPEVAAPPSPDGSEPPPSPTDSLPVLPTPAPPSPDGTAPGAETVEEPTP
jgi:hypothetical protein